MNKKTIFFFIRRFNDIDHITPIVYKFFKTTDHRLVVICLNQGYDLLNDFRIVYLRETLNVSVHYFHDYYNPSLKGRVLSRFLKYGYSNNKLSPFRLFRKLVGNKRIQRLIHDVYNDGWADKLIQFARPDALVFDWVKKEQHMVGSFINAAKLNNIPTISVPHGFSLIVNEIRRNKEAEDNKPASRGELYNHFDKFVVQFDSYKKLCVKTGLPEDKVAVLGSARYCKEWRAINKTILPRQNERVFRQKEKLKVVFMEYPYNYRIHQDRVKTAIMKVGELDFVDLVIKPHTRANKLYEHDLNAAGFIAYDTPSMTLCQMADIVIGIQSSVLLEPLLEEKILVYPKYFHENTMLFETMGTCWQVNDDNELINALKKMYKEPDFKPYAQSKVKDLVVSTVNGGKESPDILANYVSYIESVSNQGKDLN